MIELAPVCCAYDNAARESAIGTIKLELVEQHVFATREIAQTQGLSV